MQFLAQPLLRLMLVRMRIPPRYLDGPYTSERQRPALVMVATSPRHQPQQRLLNALRPGIRLALSTLVLCTLGGLSVMLLAHMLSA
jgi:hypothetical protein